MFVLARWRYRGRAGSLAEYERVDGFSVAQRLLQLCALPWFACNVVLKALTLAKIRRGPWPY